MVLYCTYKLQGGVFSERMGTIWPALQWQGGKARLAERVGTEVSVSGSAAAGPAECRKRWRQVGALAVWGWGGAASSVAAMSVAVLAATV